MWTEDYKRSDATSIACINLIQSYTTHCAKLRLMRAHKIYTDVSFAQVTALGLFGGFSFRGFRKKKGGDSWIHSTAQRKEHSKTEFGKKNSENEFGESETFYRSKFSRATGVRKCLSQLQLPCNGSTCTRRSLRNFLFREGDLTSWTVACTRCSLRNFLFREGDLTSWIVASKLQLTHCWRAAHFPVQYNGDFTTVKLHLNGVLEK